jgi:hypothetical protein
MPDTTDYESLTVPELKHLAEKRGIELPYDARKAEIIAALEASDVLLKPEGKEEGEKREGKNIYEYQTSSTETALMSEDDFWRLKLVS